MFAQMPIRLRRASFATNRIFLLALFLAVLILGVLSFTLPLAAQEPAQDPAQTTGVSHPPQDNDGEPNDNSVPIAKPSPSTPEPAATPATQPELLQSAPHPDPQAAPDTNAQPAVQTRDSNQDDGIVGDTPRVAANSNTLQPASSNAKTMQNPTDDPDGDIVQPRHAEPGEILEGTTIRVRLTDRLSSASSAQGTPFKSRVSSDVISNGQVLIPTGSEIDGQISKVSSGDHLGASGFMRLRPETIILPDGTSYHISSVITGTPGSKTKFTDEGTIKAGSRLKRDSVEYAGVVTGGVITGAFLGGPVGALTGGAVGAGVVTTHLLVSHPQAVLEPGTVLLITLISPLHMNPLNAQAQLTPQN